MTIGRYSVYFAPMIYSRIVERYRKPNGDWSVRVWPFILFYER